MSQRSVEYHVGSPGTGAAISGGGAPVSPRFHCPARTDTRKASADVATPSPDGPPTRTLTCARPGITPGSRTLTRARYGPASPAKNVSGLPTCAIYRGAYPYHAPRHAVI